MIKKAIIIYLLLLTIALLGCTQNESTQTTITQDFSSTTEDSTTTYQITTATTTEDTTQMLITCEDGYSIYEGNCVLDANLNPFQRTYTLEEVTEDFDQMVITLHRDNPLLFGNQSDIEEFIEQQRLKLVDNMTIYEFYRIMSPIAMAYKCGHTVLNLDYDTYQFTYDNAKFFPLDVKIINKEIIVVGNNEVYEIPLGSVIAKINGKYADRLLDELLAYVPADGDSVNGRYEKLNQRFSMTYYYVYPSDSFEIMYREPDSIYYEYITINAETMATINKNNDIEPVVNAPYSSFFEDEYAILTIKSFSAYGIYSNSDFYDFFFDFFTEVHTKNIQDVIIDIRQNWGGDPLIASDLFSYIAAYSQQYFTDDSPPYYTTLSRDVPLSEPHYNGRLYILIDGITFSTAGHFAALVKFHEIATFIGSETSGSFAVSDSHKEIRLTNTRLQLYTSQEIWKVAVEGLPIGRGVLPDFEVYKSWQDYVDGIDRVLEYTLSLIEEGYGQ